MLVSTELQHTRHVCLLHVHLVVLLRTIWLLHFRDQTLQHLFVQEGPDDFSQKGLVPLHVIDDVNLVEKDARVEHVEGRVVDSAREHDVFEELEPIRMVHLSLDALVADRYRLVIAGRLMEEFTVVGLVGGEFWVVCST